MDDLKKIRKADTACLLKLLKHLHFCKDSAQSFSEIQLRNFVNKNARIFGLSSSDPKRDVRMTEMSTDMKSFVLDNVRKIYDTLPEIVWNGLADDPRRSGGKLDKKYSFTKQQYFGPNGPVSSSINLPIKKTQPGVSSNDKAGPRRKLSFYHQPVAQEANRYDGPQYSGMAEGNEDEEAPLSLTLQETEYNDEVDADFQVESLSQEILRTMPDDLLANICDNDDEGDDDPHATNIFDRAELDVRMDGPPLMPLNEDILATRISRPGAFEFDDDDDELEHGDSMQKQPSHSGFQSLSTAVPRSTIETSTKSSSKDSSSTTHPTSKPTMTSKYPSSSTPIITSTSGPRISESVYPMPHISPFKFGRPTREIIQSAPRKRKSDDRISEMDENEQSIVKTPRSGLKTGNPERKRRKDEDSADERS